jgi:hypothetical protein
VPDGNPNLDVSHLMQKSAQEEALDETKNAGSNALDGGEHDFLC